MKLKIKPNHLLVYAVRGRKKYKGFYTPQKKSYADYFELVPVWVSQIGDNCKVVNDGVAVNSKCYLLDAFELEPVPLVDLESYPVPQEAVDDMINNEGFLEFNLIHENALMGMECPSEK